MAATKTSSPPTPETQHGMQCLVVVVLTLVFRSVSPRLGIKNGFVIKEAHAPVPHNGETEFEVVVAKLLQLRAFGNLQMAHRADPRVAEVGRISKAAVASFRALCFQFIRRPPMSSGFVSFLSAQQAMLDPVSGA